MPVRRAIALLILCVPFVSLLPTAAEEPPYKRLLQGEDAKKAAELNEKINDCTDAGRFNEALGLAKELLALRTRVQGADHWESIDAKWEVDGIAKVTALPAEQQADWVKLMHGSGQASALEKNGQPTKALPLRRRLLDRCREVFGERHYLTADSYNSLASCLDDVGKPGEAEPLYRKSLALWQQLVGDQHPQTVIASGNVGYNLGQQGRYAEAEVFLRKSLELGRHLLEEGHLANLQANNNLAVNLEQQGKAAEGEAMLRRTLELFRRHRGEEDADTANCWINLGVNLEGQGKYAESEQATAIALGICQRVLGEKHPLTCSAHNNLATCLQRQHKHRAAETHFRKALETEQQLLGKEHPLTVRFTANLAANLAEQQDWPAAERLLRSAIDSYQNSLGRVHPDTAQAIMNLAVTLDRQGKHAEAEGFHRQDLESYRRALGEHHQELVWAHAHFAANQAAQDKRAQCIEQYQAAVGTYEAARLRIRGAGLDRGSFGAMHQTAYPMLAAKLAQAGQEAAAWTALEAHLGRGLLDDLASRTPRPLQPEERQRQQLLNQRLERLAPAVLALVIKAEPTAEERQRLGQLLEERVGLERDLADLAVRVAKREVADLALVQERLPADAALLAWVDVQNGYAPQRGVSEHWACVLKREGPPIWVKLPASGQRGEWTKVDSNLAEETHNLLAGTAGTAGTVGKSGPPRDWPQAAQRLYQQRLKPVEEHLKDVRRLIVLSAGSMDDVPVEALTDRYVVSYAPSATVFARLQEQHRERPREARLLALGDPTFLPAAPINATDPKTTVTRGIPAIRPLPGTRQEVLAVADLFGDKTLLLGADASEQRLFALAGQHELKRFQVLHLATHGQVDRGRASRCALLLAQHQLSEPGKPAGAGQRFFDGKLSVGEILDEWELGADLVVLSACETGLGQEGGGEGLMGFCQALLSRGARSLIVSLWPVSDTATALLMVRFYENWLGKRPGLVKPMSKAEALREAKLWLRNLSRKDVEERIANLPEAARGLKLEPTAATSPAARDEKPFSHPYYWSAFILIGDPE